MNYFNEFLLTFSNNKSFFSSKKLERFIVFLTFLLITQVYLYYHIREMDATSFIEVLAIWLGYGGWNAILSQRDKKIEQNEQTG